MSDLISQARRFPERCLYCPVPATSWQHILSEGVGGRLKAPILCEAHNQLIAVRADEPLCNMYRPLTLAVGVHRQRGGADGKIGTRFIAQTASGRALTIFPDGSSEYKLEAEKTEAGIVQRAAGPLHALEKIADQHPHPAGFQLFEVVQRGEVIPVAIGIDFPIHPALLKIGLEFAAGFVAEPPHETIDALAPYVLEPYDPGRFPSPYLRTIPFSAPAFDRAGPTRHEVTIYPGGDDAYVTIMLFSAFTTTVKLPGMRVETALRYRQLLDGTGPELFPVEPVLIPFDEPLSSADNEALLDVVKTRVESIFGSYLQRQLTDIAVSCANDAFTRSLRNPEAFFSWFDAALDRYVLPPKERRALQRWARARLLTGQSLWDEDSFRILR